MSRRRSCRSVDAARTLHGHQFLNDINAQQRISNPMLMLAEGVTLLSGNRPGTGAGKIFERSMLNFISPPASPKNTTRFCKSESHKMHDLTFIDDVHHFSRSGIRKHIYQVISIDTGSLRSSGRSHVELVFFADGKAVLATAWLVRYLGRSITTVKRHCRARGWSCDVRTLGS